MNKLHSSLRAAPSSFSDARHLLLMAEQERHRLSRLLHGDVGQLITAVVLNLEFWRGAPLPEEERADSVQELKRALSMIRDVSLATRSVVIDSGGLVPALHSHLATCTRGASLTIEFDHSSLGVVLPESLEVVSFQILRRAIDNVVMHASAGKMMLRLTSQNRTFTALVQDDGVGFDPECVAVDCAAGGIMQMRQIAHAIGGFAEFKSVPDQGSTVHVELPFD